MALIRKSNHIDVVGAVLVAHKHDVLNAGVVLNVEHEALRVVDVLNAGERVGGTAAVGLALNISASEGNNIRRFDLLRCAISTEEVDTRHIPVGWELLTAANDHDLR